MPEDTTHRLFREAAATGRNLSGASRRKREGGPVGRIEWHGSTMGGTNGFVNGVSLFHIGYGLSQPPHGNDHWVLSGELPVRTRKGFKSQEEAQGGAEKILEAFIQKLGATFPPEPPQATGEPRTAFEAWWAAETAHWTANGAPVGRDAAKELAQTAYDAGFADATKVAGEIFGPQPDDED